jgi:hypothetical protein
MKIGKANYSANKRERFKIKDGDNIFRILPPMGDLADKGIWRVYYSVVWGYKDTSGRNRPFLDCRVRNYKTKMIEVESDAFLKSDKLKKQNDEVRKQIRDLTQSGQSVPQELVDKAKELKELTLKYNIDNKHHLNVMTLDGKIGLLKLGARGFNALRATIDKLKEKGIDPLSVDNGRFFNISRSGTGLDTVYQVSVYKENVEVNGEFYEKDKVHQLTDAIIGRLSEEAFELDKLYPAPTAEEVSRIVNGDESDVDAVLGVSETKSEKTQTTSLSESVNVESTQQLENTTQLTQQATTQQQTETTTPAATTTTQQQTETTPAATATTQSEEDFLAEIMKGVS